MRVSVAYKLCARKRVAVPILIENSKHALRILPFDLFSKLRKPYQLTCHIMHIVYVGRRSVCIIIFQYFLIFFFYFFIFFSQLLFLFLFYFFISQVSFERLFRFLILLNRFLTFDYSLLQRICQCRRPRKWIWYKLKLLFLLPSCLYFICLHFLKHTQIHTTRLSFDVYSIRIALH